MSQQAIEMLNRYSEAMGGGKQATAQQTAPVRKSAIPTTEELLNGYK